MATVENKTRESSLRRSALKFLNQVPGSPDSLLRFLQPRSFIEGKLAPAQQIEVRTASALPVKDAVSSLLVSELPPVPVHELNEASNIVDDHSKERNGLESPELQPRPNQIDVHIAQPQATVPTEPNINHSAAHTLENVAPHNGTTLSPVIDISGSVATNKETHAPPQEAEQDKPTSEAAQYPTQPPQTGEQNEQHETEQPSHEAITLAETNEEPSNCNYSQAKISQFSRKIQSDRDTQVNKSASELQTSETPILEASRLHTYATCPGSTPITGWSRSKGKESMLSKFLRRKNTLPGNTVEAEHSSVSQEDAKIFAEQIKPHIRALLRHKTQGMRHQQDDLASCELVMMHHAWSSEPGPVILFTCHRPQRCKQIRTALEQPALESVLTKFGYPTVVQVDPSLGFRGDVEKMPDSGNERDGIDSDGFSIFASVAADATTLTGTLLRISVRANHRKTTSLSCTAGGLISVDGKKYGVTCSHAVARVLRPEYDSLDEDEETDLAPEMAPDTIERAIGKTAIVSSGAFSDEQPDFDWLLFNIDQHILLPNDVSELWTRSHGSLDDDAVDNICVLRTSHGDLTGRVCMGTTMFDIGLASYDVVRIELDEPILCGDSGTWVLRQGKLFGMAIAGRDFPPTAYVLPASDVFNDISKQLGKRVELIPEAADLSGVEHSIVKMETTNHTFIATSLTGFNDPVVQNRDDKDVRRWNAMFRREDTLFQRDKEETRRRKRKEEMRRRRRKEEMRRRKRKDCGMPRWLFLLLILLLVCNLIVVLVVPVALIEEKRAHSTMGSSTSTSGSPTSTSRPPTSTSRPPNSIPISSNSTLGHTDTETVQLGVGIGVGVPTAILAIALMVYCSWRDDL